MRLLFAILLLLMTGCITQIDDLRGKIKDEHWIETRENESITGIKYHYFTPQAIVGITSIPCVSGITISGSYVIGANFWGTLAGILSGSGYSRKNVMSETALWRYGPEAIIHEYIHHLDSMGRSGDKEFVNLDEFKRAYIRMAKDSKWAGLVHYTEPRANSFFTNVFGLGEMSEHVAYVGGRMAAQGSGPDYMWDVFRKVLKKPWQKQQ